jgi:hypothetical protein
MTPQHIILLITHVIWMLNLSRPLSKFIHDVITSMQWAHGYGEQNVQRYSKEQINIARKIFTMGEQGSRVQVFSHPKYLLFFFFFN